MPRPDFYTSDAFRARVTDSEGAPVEGAVVVAIWRRIQISSADWFGTFLLKETRTDARGEFTIGRWGPHFLQREYFLDRRDPEIWILKRGYLLGYFDNEGALDPHYFDADQPLGPGKLSPAGMAYVDRSTFSRSAEGGSIWSGRALPLQRISDPAAAKRSLMASNPNRDHYLFPLRLPAFWDEWLASRDALPADVAASIDVPAPLTAHLERVADERREAERKERRTR